MVQQPQLLLLQLRVLLGLLVPYGMSFNAHSLRIHAHSGLPSNPNYPQSDVACFLKTDVAKTNGFRLFLKTDAAKTIGFHLLLKTDVTKTIGSH